MTLYSTPGVYFEWLDAPRGFPPVRTDIAGLVGIAERGPLHTPVRVESWAQFTAFFGGHISYGYLAYAVQGFFANGGRICYVVRVADPQWAKKALLDLVDPRSGVRLRLTASSEGAWAHEMVVSVLFTAERRFTLSLRLPSGLQETWRDLSLDDPADERHAVRVLSPRRRVNLACDQDPDLAQPPVPGSRLVEACLPSASAASAGALLALESLLSTGRLLGGANGLWTLLPEHLNGALAATTQKWGLAALADIPEIAMVAMPDLIPPRDLPLQPPLPPVDCLIPDAGSDPLPPQTDPDLPPVFTELQVRTLRQSLVSHCEALKDRMALVEPPLGMSDPQQLISLRREYDSSYGAMYFPWLRVPDPLELDGLLRSVPPCGHLAGVYARVELARGVHKPPANELLEAAQDVTREVDDITHGLLNEAHVNVLRTSSARGMRVMGARTLSSDTQWRFVNVRRLLLNIERNIQTNSQWLPFEPNNPDLWRDVDRLLRNFLDDLFQRGMLDGDTAEQAYFVDCSPATNPPFLTDQGQMIAVIGVRPPYPAEFVIVRIGRTESGLSFIEEKTTP